MTLNEFIERLQEIKESGHAGDYEVTFGNSVPYMGVHDIQIEGEKIVLNYF